MIYGRHNFLKLIIWLGGIKMKGLTIEFKELTDAREIIEQRPPRFMLYFLYFIIIMVISLLTWSYLANKEIVVQSQGMIIASEKQSITPLVSGQIETINFQEGDLVKTGDLIIELAHHDLDEKLAYDQSIIDMYDEQSSIYLKYEDSVNQMVNLFDKNNQDELESYYDYESFKLQYDLATTSDEKEQVKAQKLITIYNQIKQLANTKNQYETDKKSITLQIKNYQLYADIDGIIHYPVPIGVGDTLQAGYEAVRINSDDENKKIQIYITNQDIAKIKVGQAIRVDVAALSNREYGFGKAIIKTIATDATVNQQSGQSFYIVEAELLTPSLKSKTDEKDLNIGMVVNTRMITGEQKYLFWIIEKLNLWVFN